MIEAWRRLTEHRSGWFWLAGPLRNGDTYHVCSLAAAFSAHHGRGDRPYLIVAHPFQAKLAELFRDDFEEILVASEISGAREHWQAYFAQNELPLFGRNIPILLHPTCYDWGQAAIEMTGQTHRTWMDLYKRLLHLPFDVEPSFPGARADLRDRARELCEAADMPQGRSVILFPYAQSLPTPAQACFAELADDLGNDGYAVYTSVANAEEPVAGTTAIFLPFDLVIEAAEFAGWVVATRSGICDIVSSARCRKTFVYPDFDTVLGWSVGAMDLARDAQEISFPFVVGEPARFSALVRTGSSVAPMAAPPRRLTALIGTNPSRAGATRTVSFWAVSDDTLRAACDDVRTGTLAAFVVGDVPSCRHPRAARPADRFIPILDAPGGLEIFACRDTQTVAFFEQIDGSRLRDGAYAAANNWHSVVIASAEDDRRLERLLPDHLVETTIVRQVAIADGVTIRFGEFYGSADHVSAISNTKPLSLGGVQLLDGWSYLESWGIWSVGLRSRLRASTRRPITPGTVLEIEVNGCVSPNFPEIGMTLMLNGRNAGRYAIAQPFHGRLSVPLGDLSVGATTLDLVFAFDEVRSPQEQSLAPDVRRLGLGLTAMTLRTA